MQRIALDIEISDHNPYKILPRYTEQLSDILQNNLLYESKGICFKRFKDEIAICWLLSIPFCLV